MSAQGPPAMAPGSSPGATSAANPSSGVAGGPSAVPNAAPGGSGSASANASKTFQRAYKACDQCRQRKVRCDLGSLEEPLEPPCRRCRRELRACTWLAGTRGKSRASGAHTAPPGFDHASFTAAAGAAAGEGQEFKATSGSAAGGTNMGGVVGGGSSTGGKSIIASSTPVSWSQVQSFQAASSPTSLSAMHPPPPPSASATTSAAPAGSAWNMGRSASTPQLTGASANQLSQMPTRPSSNSVSSASSLTQQYPSHLGLGGVSEYFHSAAAAAAAAASTNGSGSGNGNMSAPPLVRSHSSSSSSGAQQLYGAGNGGANGSVGGASGGDHGSDASSPTSRASLALIKLSNSSEAVKALSYVGNAEADDDDEEDAERDRGGEDEQEGDRQFSQKAGSRKRKSSSVTAAGSVTSPSAAAGGPVEESANAASANEQRKGSDSTRPAKARRVTLQDPSTGGSITGATSGVLGGVQQRSKNAVATKKRLRDWRDFEPVRQKIIKASEAKYLVKYFFQHVHGFSPLCSERYMRNTKETRSELISKEPLLLGAILSIASRFCIGADQDAAANLGVDPADVSLSSGLLVNPGVSGNSGGAPAGGASSTRNAADSVPVAGSAGRDPKDAGSSGNGAIDRNSGGASFGLALHQRISAWTHQMAGRVLVDCSLHSIGSVEGLLLLAEWSTWGIHSHNSDYLAEEEDDDDDDDEEQEENQEAAKGANDAEDHEMEDGAASATNQASNNHRRASKGSNASSQVRRRESAARRHAEEIATTSQRFDSMSWMFVGMAIRLAEELQLQKSIPEITAMGFNDGGDAFPPEIVEQAERRLRVWLDCVSADTQISIRLGRRFTSGGLSPEWMEVIRARTYRLPDTLPDPVTPRGAVNGNSGAANSNGATAGDNRNFVQADDLVGAAKHDPFIDEARKWVAWRGHAELVNKLRNAHDMLNESESRTQSMMENDRFESILRPFRNDLDSYVRWLQPKIGYPGGGMRTFGIRIDYHFTRLTVFRMALDALVLRARRIGRPDGLAALGEGLSDTPTFPFAKEAVDAARSLVVIMSVDLQSLRCAPPRYFLYLVLAVMVCMQACELSESLMLPMHCASILREAINALNAVALDERHLAHRYALMLRNAGKRLLHAEETDPTRDEAVKKQRPVSDLKLVNGDQPQHHPIEQPAQHYAQDQETVQGSQGARQTVPTITVVPRAQPPPPAAIGQGPSFASDIVPPSQGADLEDLWSWLGNIDQAVPSTTAEGPNDASADNILNFDLLGEGNAAPFFFPNINT